MKEKNGMAAYVNYLLEDISNAERSVEKKEEQSPREDCLEARMLDVERFITHEPRNKFSRICGLSPEIFPPAEKLSMIQLRQVNAAFTRMLATWNMTTGFPKRLPTARCYELMVSILDEKAHVMNYGFLCFDFCTEDPEGCAFGIHCTCRRVVQRFEAEERGEREIKKSKKSQRPVR